MKYIGIDPGAYTGIAFMEDKKIVGVCSIDSKKTEKAHKLLYYYTSLTARLSEYAPDVVYCEEPFMHFPQAGKSMNKKLAIVELVCSQLDIKLVYINPSTVKKIITGNGKAVKEVVADTLIGKVTNNKVVIELIENKKFDETDAIAIAIAGKQLEG